MGYLDQGSWTRAQGQSGERLMFTGIINIIIVPLCQFLLITSIAAVGVFCGVHCLSTDNPDVTHPLPQATIVRE